MLNKLNKLINAAAIIVIYPAYVGPTEEKILIYYLIDKFRGAAKYPPTVNLSTHLILDAKKPQTILKVKLRAVVQEIIVFSTATIYGSRIHHFTVVEIGIKLTC
jgi:hypothetical protein